MGSLAGVEVVLVAWQVAGVDMWRSVEYIVGNVWELISGSTFLVFSLVAPCSELTGLDVSLI